jgi:predicted nucleotidyltransferase
MATLEAILGDSLHVTLLRWLSNVQQPTSGSAIARTLGLPQSSTRLALERLVETSVVTRTDIGRSAGYALNEHLAVVRHIILPVFRREDKLRVAHLHQLRRASRQLMAAADQPPSAPPATFIALFGSLARGQRNYRDIDLLVVSTSPRHHDALRDRLSDLAAPIERRFGVPIRPVIVSEADLAAGHADALARDVRAEGIGLAGSPPPALAGIRLSTAWPARGAK